MQFNPFFKPSYWVDAKPHWNQHIPKHRPSLLVLGKQGEPPRCSACVVIRHRKPSVKDIVGKSFAVAHKDSGREEETKRGRKAVRKVPRRGKRRTAGLRKNANLLCSRNARKSTSTEDSSTYPSSILSCDSLANNRTSPRPDAEKLTSDSNLTPTFQSASISCNCVVESEPTGTFPLLQRSNAETDPQNSRLERPGLCFSAKPPQCTSCSLEKPIHSAVKSRSECSAESSSVKQLETEKRPHVPWKMAKDFPEATHNHLQSFKLERQKCFYRGSRIQCETKLDCKWRSTGLQPGTPDNPFLQSFIPEANPLLQSNSLHHQSTRHNENVIESRRYMSAAVAVRFEVAADARGIVSSYSNVVTFQH